MAAGKHFAGTRKVQEVGGSKAGILPHDVAEKWGVEQGDELYIQEKGDGGIEIYPCGSPQKKDGDDGSCSD